MAGDGEVRGCGDVANVHQIRFLHVLLPSATSTWSRLRVLLHSSWVTGQVTSALQWNFPFIGSGLDKEGSAVSAPTQGPQYPLALIFGDPSSFRILWYYHRRDLWGNWWNKKVIIFHKEKKKNLQNYQWSVYCYNRQLVHLMPSNIFSNQIEMDSY